MTVRLAELRDLCGLNSLRRPATLDGQAARPCAAALFERAEQQHDQPRRRACSHQPDAPDLAGQRTEPGADLDAVLLEQLLAHRRLVHAVRDAHGVQRPQPLAFAAAARDSPIAFSPSMNARWLRSCRAQRASSPSSSTIASASSQRADQRRRHRVVILPAHPVVLEQLQIEVEAAALHAPRERARAEHDRRQARRRAQTFLRAAVDGVDAPGADIERMAAERRDRVDDRERAVLARDRRQLARPDSARPSTFRPAPSPRCRRAPPSAPPQRVGIARASPLDVERA